MSRNRFALLLFVLILALSVSSLAMAQDADPAQADSKMASNDVSGPFDLERCVQRALNQNPSMTAVRAQLRGARHGARSALGNFGPTLGGAYGYTYYNRGYTYSGEEDNWVGSLNLTQPIFKGFNLLATWQRAELSAESTEATLDQVELTLVENVQTAYLTLLRARMDVKSAEDSVARLKSQLDVISAFYDVGLRPKAEVLDAEVDLATAEQNLLTARNTVSTQEAQLNTLLNIPLSTEVEYVGELNYIPFDLSLDECLKRAYNNRPDLVIGAKSVEIAEKDVTMAESSYYPDVEGSVDYVRRGVDADLDGGGTYTHESSEYWTAGVNASMTFFQWGADYYDAKQTQESVKQLEAELENTRLNAGFEVKRALLSIQEAADRITVAKKSVAAGEEAYRMAVARYQAQVGTNTDVLNAQERLTSSAALLSEALADYGTAVSALYVAMGEKNLGLKEVK